MMVMTAEEIRRSYRLAKNPERQLRVLADLNNCPKCKIAEIVGAELPKTRRNRTRTNYTPELDAKIIGLRKDNKLWKEISAIVGISVPALSRRYNKHGAFNS